MSIFGFRKPIAAVLTAAVLLAVGVAAATLSPAEARAAGCPGARGTPRQISSKVASKAVVCLVNKQRAKHGLGKLHPRRTLTAAARRHSESMQQTRCFDHICPGEPTLPARYARTDYLPCGCSWGAAENIAWGRRKHGSPRAIVHSWMQSPPHRANILNGTYDDIGVGVRWGSPNERAARAGTYTLDLGYRR